MAKDRTQKDAQTGAQSTEGNETQPAAGTAAEGAGTSTEGGEKKEAKPSKKGQPVPIGKRRALGLALRGLMAEVAAGTAIAEPASPAYVAANEALGKNKYTELRPQAERLAEVQEKLQVAIAAGDGTTISKLGKELNRIKMGL